MSLHAGQQLLHYRVAEPVGEGGMGVVWKAQDTKLGRDVALKVLPAEVSGDPDRLARFDREARTLAALHHPHVASIFGFEESEGVRFLVMELVEGEDLARRIDRGPLGTTEALEIGGQIAEGLEAAHEQGIVHRDLKPANVKITPDGMVKVLDFGLAKAWRGDGPDVVSSSGDLSQSPTLAHTGTAAGLILGTAAYMSPEQARGKPVDKRSDIWSFGVVLFEMLTGKPLFRGETLSDVLASVLKVDVDFSKLPDDTPAAARRLLRRCLERDPKQRLRDIGDARIEIAAARSGVAPESDAAVQSAPAPRRATTLLPWLVAAALAVLAITLWLLPAGAESGGPVSYELSLSAPADGQWMIGSNNGWGVIAPDGRRIVARLRTSEGTGLWVQNLDGTGGRLLPRTEEGFYPFWSPDSRWVAFFSRGFLQRVEVDGGLPERVGVAPWGRGGSWSESGRILMTPSGGGSVHIVEAAGGEPRPVTRLDGEAGEDAHYWPAWLPDGERFLYFIRSARRENQGIYLGRVLVDGPDDTRHRVVASSSSGLFIPDGFGGAPMLLWVEEETLLARAFDLQSGSLMGPTARVAEGVNVVESQRGTMASVSRDGTLVWAQSRFGRLGLTWFDRNGRVLDEVSGPDASIHQPLSSPDGRWMTFVAVKEGNGDIWLLDTETGESRALTSSAEYEEGVVWSPDSSEILYRGGGGEDRVFFRMRVDGSDSPRPVFEFREDRPITSATAWLPGGWIVLNSQNTDGTTDMVAIDMDDPEETVALVGGNGDQAGGLVSPGGDALAYLSDESGSLAGYVASLSMNDSRPTLGPDRQRIALDGLFNMQWSLEGDRLFGLTTQGTLFAIPVGRGAGRLRVGAPEMQFDAAGIHNSPSFGVAPGGVRFLFVANPDAKYQTLSVLLNWQERLN